MAAFSKRPDRQSCLVRWRLKLAEYEDEIVYKAGKINANIDAFLRNPTSVLPLKISEETDPKEPPSRRESLRKRFPKGGTVTDSASEETQPDINTQSVKTNNDTENKHNESSSENE